MKKQICMLIILFLTNGFVNLFPMESGSPSIFFLINHRTAYPYGVEKGDPVLHGAITRGRVDYVKKLLSDGFDEDSEDAHGRTALELAVCNSQEQIIKILLAAGANPNRVGPRGNRALSRAVDEQTVKLLLAAGANPTTKDCWGYPVGLQEQTPEIKNYIEKKMRMSKELHDAAKIGKIDLMRNALKNGALINMPDENGNTPLHLAIMSGNEDAVKLLLRFANLINFSLKNDKAQAVLDLAADSGMFSLIFDAIKPKVISRRIIKIKN